MAKLLVLCEICLTIVLCLLSVPHNFVLGSNVLAVLPSVWQSHYIFGRRLLQQLAEKQNYSITLISSYCKEPNSEDDNFADSPKAFKEIHVDGLLENWIDMGLSFDIEQAHQQSMLERFTRLIYAGTANVDLLLANANVRKLLRSDEKFDLLFIDLFLSDALLGLALYYDVPTIVISPNGANSWLNRMIGNPQSSALDPSNFLPYSERMSVWQRCANTLMGLFEKLTYNFFHMISQQAVYVKHFQSLYQLANNTTINLPHHRELTQNLSLVILNTNPVVQYPRAFLPNVLPVGGIHLQTKPKGIPNHIKMFIEASSRGSVYISLGADARTIDLARDKLDILFDVMSFIDDVNFLLKWESDDYPKDLPPNVLLNSWFPQEEILAHPNIKVFISACGVMSVLESINGLTPLLAIPIYPEQFVTATRLQWHGLAVIVSFDAITYAALLDNIEKLLGNSSYHSNVESARTLLFSDYGTPTAKTLHYIDLVQRTGGADYLKTHAHHLNFMRSKLFDVIAIITLGLGGILAIPFLAICCILKKSYNNQNVETAAAATATANTAAALTRSRSKISLLTANSSSTNLNSGNLSPKTANINVGIMTATTTTTVSVPSLKQQDASSTTGDDVGVKRRLSASALWAMNSSSSHMPCSAVQETTSSSDLFYVPSSSPGPPENNEHITKTT